MSEYRVKRPARHSIGHFVDAFPGKIAHTHNNGTKSLTFMKRKTPNLKL